MFQKAGSLRFFPFILHKFFFFFFLLAESRNSWSRCAVEDGVPWMKETPNIGRKQHNNFLHWQIHWKINYISIKIPVTIRKH